MKILGFVVNKKGITMESKRVNMILDWPEPKMLTQVQEFIGFVNFYHRFIFNMSDILKPITDLTRKNMQLFKWNTAALEAMRKIKHWFSTEPLLRRFNLIRPIYIFTDASGYVAVAILMQWYNNHLYPISFWSQKFTPAKQNYSIMEQELLPIVKALTHWQHYCKGARHCIQVYIDHYNLQYFNTLECINRCLAH